MDDLTARIQALLGSEEGMNQVRSMAAALGLGGEGGGEPPQTPPPPSAGGNGGIDLSALAGMLGAFQGGQNPPGSQSANSSPGGGIDLSALAGMLGAFQGGQNPSGGPSANSSPGGGIDLSALAGMLGAFQGGQNPSGGPSTNSGPGGGPAVFTTPSASSMPSFDPKLIGLLQKAMSAFGTTDKNVELLYALKPHLSPERRPKVDEAVRLMQIFKMLPALGESGIFSEGGLLSMLGGAR